MKNEGFLLWLINKKGLKRKSASDVLSRLKRVEIFVDLQKKDSAEKVISALRENKAFSRLSMSVRSQLRIAIKHFFLYKQRG